ncbi:hypothetical protein ASPZODRAFT_155200 [Penicilliopsis zonata CBS 506.65]|uniref:Uncharacterized protein n=1 Tax=Penicilliopsis zonata CBS 506.65 TaxID=1073090 RepID=A0A1L9S6I0_9EURO|nr:hypothetical protein ASPZODRAFT_155200 [Penicilliopsis zonata CBS 506.65]OJJ42747.1 hypothetical protein ASPZODRAFT_155200 [Penicilliopsis zonata CBS 506.65]
MAGPKILLLTNSEYGQAIVTLSVAHEFLLRDYDVHVASFSPLRRQVDDLNARAAKYGATGTVTFHEVAGLSMKEAFKQRWSSTGYPMHPPGFHASLETFRSLLVQLFAAWDGPGYMEGYESVLAIMEEIQPEIITVEPAFGQAVDACQKSGREFIVLSPNFYLDHVVQPRLGNVWKYPAVCSGYPFPIPWRLFLPNIYLNAGIIKTYVSSPITKALNRYRNERGLSGPLPIYMSLTNPRIPFVLACTPEIDLPCHFTKQYTGCGPILLPYRPVAVESPELAAWLAKAPTVLINLGSNVEYTAEDVKQFVEGIQVLLSCRSDVQVLWKRRMLAGQDGDSVLPDDPSFVKRVRIENWLDVDPGCILESGNVICMVHHGGANSYNEAITAGIPHIVLPVWFDTYAFANRVEYHGIGVWGSKKSAPHANGKELGEAFRRVLASEESETMHTKAQALMKTLSPTPGRVLAFDRIFYTMAETQIAWIGLGNMGRGMCKNIVEKGPQKTPVIIFNRTAARATAFAETLGGADKATVATSIPEAVTPASVVFICVGDDPAVEQIVESILTVDVTGKTIVDCSTVHPDTTRRVNETLTQRGASFVACPVFGAPAFADAGQLVAVPAGPTADVARIKPFLQDVTSRAVIDMSGGDIGRASLLKILGNTYILNTVETLSEGMVLAEKSGLGTDAYQQWMEIMFPGAFAKYAHRMTSGDYYQREEPLFAVDLARKDLRHAKNLAADAGVRLPSTEITDAYLASVKETKGEKGDIAGIYGAVRKESGLPYENK